MVATAFSELVRLCEELASTTKRLEKIALISELLKGLDKKEIALASIFLSGRVFSESDPRRLEVGFAALSELKSGQRILAAKPLTISRVAEYFAELAQAKGRDSRKRRRRLLEALFGEATEIEVKWLIRLIAGEMRIGVEDGMMLEAIATASGLELERIRRAHMLLGDLGNVAKIALLEGGKGIDKVGISLFTPLRPMLAEMASSFEEILAAHGGKTALEYKFDGARVQIHKRGGGIRIFSRRLSDVTSSLPEVAEVIRKEIPADEALLEGEVFGVRSGGSPLPFQELMKRFRRVHDVEEAAVQTPVELRLFDLLYLEGVSLLDLPYDERYLRLAALCRSPKLVSERVVIEAPEDGKRFLEAAMRAGHEGVMAKALDSPYTPGSRGKRWFKLKHAKHLDAMIIAAEWGHGRREGWLSNYHLAVKDEEMGGYAMVGKTFKGLTDEEFEEMTTRLLKLKISEDAYTVRVRPEVVVEVAYDEVQRSPKYESGFALRFARITRIRMDKGSEDIDTLAELKRLRFLR